MKVAVYGNMLKTLSEYNENLSDATYLGEFYTKPEYNLYTSGVDAFLVPEGTTSIRMEVYEVSVEKIRKINLNKDYLRNADDNTFNKSIIRTPYGRAVYYLYNYSVEGMDLIEDGDYQQFMKNGKIENYV